MRATILFLAAALFFAVTPPTSALMAPDGSMVQMDSYDAAAKLVKAEQYDQAIQKLKALLREHPGHANAWNALGFSQRMVGDLDAAATAYSNALTITPNHNGALNYMGQMFVQTGRIEEARELLVKLETACGPECEDYKQLRRAVEDGKAGKY